MPKNISKIEQRRIEVAEKKLANPEKSIRTIADEVGCSNPTVCRDLQYLKQDEALQEKLQELKLRSLSNAIIWTETEEKYISKIREQKDINSQDASVVSSITKTNQQRYSFLQGELSDDKWWEKVDQKWLDMINALLQIKHERKTQESPIE